MQMLQFKDQPVRIVMRGEDPWWVAADICGVLEIRNVPHAIASLDEDEKGIASSDTPGGEQQVNIINEPGLYSLIFRSRKPQAHDFKRWVTHEVLPTIRRTGHYGRPSLDDMEPRTKSFFATLDALRDRNFAKHEALEVAMQLHLPQTTRVTVKNYNSPVERRLDRENKLLAMMADKKWMRSDLERSGAVTLEVGPKTVSRLIDEMIARQMLLRDTLGLYSACAPAHQLTAN